MSIEVRSGEFFLEIVPGSHVYLECEGKEPSVIPWDDLMLKAVWLYLGDAATLFCSIGRAILEMQSQSSGSIECQNQKKLWAEQFTSLAMQLYNN